MTAKTEPELGAGDITITLGGAPVVLKPSLDACTALTTDPAGIFGGDGSLYSRIAKFDIGVMARVIRLGLGLGASAVKDLDRQVYEAGLASLVGPLQDFLVVIVNGGRKPVVVEGGDDTSPPDKAADA